METTVSGFAFSLLVNPVIMYICNSGTSSIPGCLDSTILSFLLLLFKLSKHFQRLPSAYMK